MRSAVRRRHARLLEHGGGDYQLLATADEVGAARHAVGEVVVPSRAVVDAVLAGAGRAPLKAVQLIHQALRLRQHDAARVEQGQ